MSIFQFLRILWAYRLIVIVTTLASFAIAFAVVQVVKPRYEAQSRVMLDVIKPDPVTGQVMSTSFLRAYTKTQIELVKDLQVARLVVDNLKWANNPQIQHWYRTSEKEPDVDFNRWAAQQIVEGANAKLIEGSNILEISYASSSPARAKAVADGLRQAYVDMTLQSRREAARRNAEWYEDQAQKAKALLLRAETIKSSFERESGIVLQDDQVDIDTARLSALAQQGAAPIIATPTTQVSQASLALAQLDAELLQASKALGPNHPGLLEMRRKRELLANQAAQERNTANAAALAAVNAQRATSGLLEAQKAKVMAQREKVERLRLMQDEITLRRDQYNKSVTRAAELRQEADVAVTGVTPLGAAVTPQAPVFPKKGLIIGASIPLGAGIGLVVALLLEFIGRRVRSADDLLGAVPAPVLAVIHDPQARKNRRPLLRWLLPTRVNWRPRAARA